MTDKHIQAEAPHSNMEKDPNDWVTGGEPMTGAQKSYLKTLSEEAGADFDESLTKADASKQIDALQKETGRGTGHGQTEKHTRAEPNVSAAEPKASRKSSKPATTEDTDEPNAEVDSFDAERDAAG